MTGEHPGEYKDIHYDYSNVNVNYYSNGSLEFQHISKDSEGHYLCEAKNEIGTGVSKVIYLKVNGEYFTAAEANPSPMVFLELGRS